MPSPPNLPDPHPLHFFTLALAALAVVFSFLAWRTAGEAKHAAERAGSGVATSGDIFHLEQQLREAGVLPPLE